MFYAGWIALAQADIKRLVAYSSIAHMGMMIIGIVIWNAVTLSGAVLQMINHGLSTSALFIMVGMLDERLHSRNFAVMGGLWSKMPVFSAFFLLFALSSLGLPGLNNFVGEMLILVGAFKANWSVAVWGFVGIVFGVIYILRMVQDSLFGEPRAEHVLWDVNAREVVILVVLAAGGACDRPAPRAGAAMAGSANPNHAATDHAIGLEADVGCGMKTGGQAYEE